MAFHVRCSLVGMTGARVSQRSGTIVGGTDEYLDVGAQANATNALPTCNPTGPLVLRARSSYRNADGTLKQGGPRWCRANAGYLRPHFSGGPASGVRRRPECRKTRGLTLAPYMS